MYLSYILESSQNHLVLNPSEYLFLLLNLFKKIKCNRATDKKQNIKNKFQESLFNRLSLLLLFLFILF
nr:MAG TPA: hypothetical protein [Caudoviricetes sp.]